MNSPSGALASWFALAGCSNPLIYSTLLKSCMASAIAPIPFGSKVQLPSLFDGGLQIANRKRQN
jgi:hypothetical protein